MLKIRLGPMKSGKTRAAVATMGHYSDLGFKTLYITYKKDEQRTNMNHDHCLATHDSTYKGMTEKVKTIKVMSLFQIPEEYVKEADVIAVDESNFYDDLVHHVKKWLIEFKKDIYVYALDGDFQARPFGHIFDLIPFSSECVKETAMCEICLLDKRKNIAPFSTKINFGGPLEEIGGSETYKMLCLEHWIPYYKKNLS